MKTFKSKADLQKFFLRDKNHIERQYPIFPIRVIFQEKFDSKDVIERDIEKVIEFIYSQKGYSCPVFHYAADLTEGELYIAHSEMYGHGQFIDSLIAEMIKTEVFKRGFLKSTSNSDGEISEEYIGLSEYLDYDFEWEENAAGVQEFTKHLVESSSKGSKATNILIICLLVILLLLGFLAAGAN